LLRAYSLIGYAPERDYRYVEINRALRRLYPAIVDEIEVNLTKHGRVRRNPDNDLLIVNEEFSVSVVIVRCDQTRFGSYRWRIRLDAALKPDITTAVRMAPGNQRPLDFYLFPHVDFASASIRLAEENELSLDAYRFEDLEPLYALAARTLITEVA
jgi:hypothetical protein